MTQSECQNLSLQTLKIGVSDIAPQTNLSVPYISLLLADIALRTAYMFLYTMPPHCCEYQLTSTNSLANANSRSRSLNAITRPSVVCRL